MATIHDVALWWSEAPGAGEITGQSGDDIWRCSCGWRDDDQYELARSPSQRAVTHAAVTGGTVRFPDPATGWRDYSVQTDHWRRSASRSMTLAAELADWTDWDFAAYRLGCYLGVLSGTFATDNKWVFWTDNPLGNGLHDALIALSRAGVLERREEPNEQFRWHRAPPHQHGN